jgi:hypothetical protein
MNRAICQQILSKLLCSCSLPEPSRDFWKVVDGVLVFMTTQVCYDKEILKHTSIPVSHPSDPRELEHVKGKWPVSEWICLTLSWTSSDVSWQACLCEVKQLVCVWGCEYSIVTTTAGSSPSVVPRAFFLHWCPLGRKQVIWCSGVSDRWCWLHSYDWFSFLFEFLVFTNLLYLLMDTESDQVI